MIVTDEMDDEVCRFRELLTRLALFDEEYSVSLLATSSSLVRSEYVLLNVESALAVALRQGLTEVVEWLQSTLRRSPDAEFGTLTSDCDEPAAVLV